MYTIKLGLSLEVKSAFNLLTIDGQLCKPKIRSTIMIKVGASTLQGEFLRIRLGLLNRGISKKCQQQELLENGNVTFMRLNFSLGK